MPNDINPVPVYQVHDKEGRIYANSPSPLKRSGAPTDVEGLNHYKIFHREDGSLHSKEMIPFVEDATEPPPSPKGKKPADPK